MRSAALASQFLPGRAYNVAGTSSIGRPEVRSSVKARWAAGGARVEPVAEAHRNAAAASCSSAATSACRPRSREL